MNIYAAVILATLALGYLLTLSSNLLNLRALKRSLPSEMDGVYDPEDYRRSQEHTRARTRLQLVQASFDLAVLLVFWWAGGFAWLDTLVRGFGLGPVATGLIYIGLLVLGQAVLSLPFQLHETFGIEERFGFNRTTPQIFVADLLKGLLLAVALGGPLVAAILLFFESAGETAWLWCWGITTLFALILQWIAPTWILPLFNRFEPLSDENLRKALMAYSKSVNFDLGGVFVVDGSRRSSRANAFFTGFGRTKRIGLYDTLIERQTVPELVAVLAHEIGHYKKKHLLFAMAIAIINSGVTFYLMSIFLSHPGLYTAFGITEPAIYTGLVFFGLLYSPIELFLSFFAQLLSRRHEFQADRFAVETVAQPEALVSALKKLAADNLTNLTPHPFYVMLWESHPPVIERIAAIRRVAA